MATNNPFAFGKAVEGEYFTDRIEDSKRLSANLSNGINTILISPRRWGKTSLVKKVISDMTAPNVRTVFLDVFQCKSESDFYQLFATAVIKQTSSKLDEWLEIAKSFLANVSPKFSFGPDPANDFSLSLDWNPDDNSTADILQLPERIALKKKVHVIVCIDEFQQIGDFSNSSAFQKRLRSVWQHQQNTTFCLFGSKKHLLEDLFNNKSMPFFKFGELMFLQKIPTADWVSYICARFQQTGKSISPDLATRICLATDNLSSYVQHLAWIVWYRSDSVVTESDVDQAITEILDQNSFFFQKEIEQLSEQQMNFLRALADGISSGFSRKDIIKKYRLESSANISAIRKALIKKDLIDVTPDLVSFNDPLFRLYSQKAGGL